jgi:hypothetical protein
MLIREKLIICVFVILLAGAIFSTVRAGGGQPLKDNACVACHADYGAIMPKTHPDVGKGEACLSCHASDASSKEATKFSTFIHKVHKGEKTTLECSACHIDK